MLGANYLKTLGYAEVIRVDKDNNQLYLYRFPLGAIFHTEKYYKHLDYIYRFVNDSKIAEFGSDEGFVKFYTKSDDGYKAVCCLFSKMKEDMDKDLKSQSNITSIRNR